MDPDLSPNVRRTATGVAAFLVIQDVIGKRKLKQQNSTRTWINL